MGLQSRSFPGVQATFPVAERASRTRHAAAALAILVCWEGTALANAPYRNPPSENPSEPARLEGRVGQRQGKPTIRLDRLDFPEDVADARRLKRHLRRTLALEARRLDWGAGRGDKVEYRFAVRRLEVERRDGVVTVTCTARGQLPKGKKATSELRFSGAPHEGSKLIRRVLDIVARGVLTRLAEMERVRRGIAPLANRDPAALDGTARS